MKCIKCHNTLHTETGEFSMTINGKTIKVINAPVLHCKNCNSIIISDNQYRSTHASYGYVKGLEDTCLPIRGEP